MNKSDAAICYTCSEAKDSEYLTLFSMDHADEKIVSICTDCNARIASYLTHGWSDNENLCDRCMGTGSTQNSGNERLCFTCYEREIVQEMHDETWATDEDGIITGEFVPSLSAFTPTMGEIFVTLLLVAMTVIAWGLK